MANIDIKDFTTLLALNESDSVLVSQAGGGAHGKIRVQLLIDAVKAKVQDGKTVALRRGADAVEWQYQGDTGWQVLIPLSDLKGAKGDTGQSVELRKTESALEWREQGAEAWQTLAQLADLKGDRGDAGAPLDFVWRGTELGVKSQAQPTPQYTDLKGDRGDTGKTPILSSVEASAGAQASGSIARDGEDGQGNPRYKVVLTLPRGEAGKAPIVEVGAVQTLSPSAPATATIQPNGEQDGRPRYALSLGIPQGLPGSLEQGDASNLVVSFETTEGDSATLPTTGESLKAILRKVVALFRKVAGLETTLGTKADANHTHTGVYAPYTHTHTEYAPTTHNHNAAYAAKAHTHTEYAASNHTHTEYLDKAYYEGANTVTTLTALPVDKRLIVANLSSATNLTLSGEMAVGREILVNINPSSDISQPIPQAGGWSSIGGGTMQLKSDKASELSILCVAAGRYVVSFVEGK